MKPSQYFQKAKALLVRRPGEKIRNYCMSMLMFIVAGHAVALRLKNICDKNVLLAKEGVQVLRIFFLAARNIFYDESSQSLLNNIKGFDPNLYAEIYTSSVHSETVVSIVLQYTLSIALLH